MKAESLLRFKGMFEEQRRAILNDNSQASEEFKVQPEDLTDEMDWTTSELQKGMLMRLRHREALFLKKIDEALARIRAGSFGACESCDGEIELRRLEARPTAELCISCKEEQEQRELLHADGRRHKSVGARFRFA
jgi:DnaK suppressor protein